MTYYIIRLMKWASSHDHVKMDWILEFKWRCGAISRERHISMVILYSQWDIHTHAFHVRFTDGCLWLNFSECNRNFTVQLKDNMHTCIHMLYKYMLALILIVITQSRSTTPKDTYQIYLPTSQFSSLFVRANILHSKQKQVRIYVCIYLPIKNQYLLVSKMWRKK